MPLLLIRIDLYIGKYYLYRKILCTMYSLYAPLAHQYRPIHRKILFIQENIKYYVQSLSLFLILVCPLRLRRL